jgi:cytoskeletal protein CcmA (bactofilin family)
MLGIVPESASAVSSWSPTLLVNTESFQTIDSGDGTTDIDLRFGTSSNALQFLNASQTFLFTNSLRVRGGLSGSYLTIDRQANISGSLTVKGATTLNSTLGVTGDVSAQSNITVNSDAGAVDALLTFGNASGNQTIKFLNTAQKFEFSRDIRVLGTISGSALRVDGNATIGGPLTVTGSIKTKGNLSGSTLTVDGAVTLRGVTYNAPTIQGATNTFLRNDGAGNLTWTTTSTGNGSGGILSLHPEYPNAVYFGSGSSYVGQMTMSGGTTSLENSYVWTSSRSGLQNYWISVRVRLPDNFSSWDPIKPIELRYKTGVASSANNDIKVMIRDTAGAYRALTGGEALANTSWTTAKITGPNAGGTWTPKGYVTVYVRLAANSTAGANAAAGFLNLNFETTTP